MQLVKTAALVIYNNFFNLASARPADMTTDVRDLPMPTRFTNTDNPQGGWAYFVMETINREQKAKDAFKVTEEGYTRFEKRVYEAIQTNFRERNGLIVTIDTIERMEREANNFPNYYGRLATSLFKYEQSHVQIAA